MQGHMTHQVGFKIPKFDKQFPILRSRLKWIHVALFYLIFVFFGVWKDRFFHWVKLVKIISVHLLFVQVLMRSSVKAIAFANVLGF